MAREEERTSFLIGLKAESIFDVGLADLWRLIKRQDDFSFSDIVMVVAGMDAVVH
ncbi:MAG: hypothetical protein AAGD13_13625 [Pseudomonadota bacterium]